MHIPRQCRIRINYYIYFRSKLTMFPKVMFFSKISGQGVGEINQLQKGNNTSDLDLLKFKT